MRKNRILSMVLIYSIFVLGIIFPVGKTTAEDIKEIDIALTPEKVLFDVNNMKPGDWATRTLTIGNSGNQDFNYIASANLLSGSDKLYKELSLAISSENGEIYNGKLGDFKNIEPRLIKSTNKEELIFTIKFPEELGNEFQGLTSIVEFKFYVEGTLGGVIPVDKRLPDTATNLLNYLVAGAIFIAGGISLFLYQRKRKLSTRH